MPLQLSSPSSLTCLRELSSGPTAGPTDRARPRDRLPGHASGPAAKRLSAGEPAEPRRQRHDLPDRGWIPPSTAGHAASAGFARMS